MSLAPSALVQLDSACELFSRTARGFRAQSVLVSSFCIFENADTIRSTHTNACLQEVMLRLREKARVSLSEYRQGQASPLTRQISEPYSPRDDLDELATLGGKTRLVAKKEAGSAASSPAVIDRSPTSLNPVVPLPLMSGHTPQSVHPNVAAYLYSFPNPENDTVHTYSSPPAYTMSPTSETSPRYQETSSYNEHASAQPMELVPGQFPNYFHVYDYGLSTEANYQRLNGQMSSAGVSRGDSPESINTMQNAWQDLVTQSGMEVE